MSNLIRLASSQKLAKRDILQLYLQLGYALPQDTRKESILTTLEEYITYDEKTKLPQNAISLDLGLKNMSLTHLRKNKLGFLEIHRWFKRNLEPDPMFQFNPINYSKITCEFLQNEILNYNSIVDPLTVVFERQRFRTGGASSVLESTLKTNTIEAMLCMGITLNNMSKNSIIKLHPSPPGAMVKYWQEKYSFQKLKTDTESKSFRINLILSMLYYSLKDLNLQPTNYPHFEALQTVKPKFRFSKHICDAMTDAAKSAEWMKSWKKAWSFKSESRRLFEVVNIINAAGKGKDTYNWGVVKGDDLADSLLHGITYFEYAANRRKLFQIMQTEADIKSSFKL